MTRAAARFAERYGVAPALTWAAPGRVNLIGEHTDYNGGFVLPFALPRLTEVAAGPTNAPQWTVWSEANGETVHFGPEELGPGAVTGWAAYVAGVVWALRSSGVDIAPARLAIASDVPLGAGLSSSAALECAVLGALVDLNRAGGAGQGGGAALPRSQWPLIAQTAENAYVGVPSGIMDQFAVTLCRPDHALFLDCRTRHHDDVPLLLNPAGLAIMVIDTRAPHRRVRGEYGARRATCVAAATALGLAALRDIDDLDAALAALPAGPARARVRHVVTENQRVLATVDALRNGRIRAIGPLLTASHASLRDDYQVSVAELDVAVDAALGAGALGARMTGAGFGGCVIALVESEYAEDVVDAVAKAFAVRGFAAPEAFVATPAGGAARTG
ncbi:MAG: galactokinase [Micromonosporaceae bacterium]